MDAHYDPRDPAQVEGDPATWKPTDNPALILATCRRQTPRPMGHRDAARLADWCEEMVPHPT